jgi:hypothetical protein
VKEHGGVKGVARSEVEAEAEKKLESAPQKAKAATQKATQHPFTGVVAALGTGWVLRSLAKSGHKSNRK